jgi:plastocyanin
MWITPGGNKTGATTVIRSMRALYRAVPLTALLAFSSVGCGGSGVTPTPSPTPTVTANAYILPGAVTLADRAFGDEPIVVYKGERLRWVNADTLTHLVVAESDTTDFRKTDALTGAGSEQSLVMKRLGTTRIHCAIHPNMTGTLIVREQ